jgi:hypothetical protein
MRVTSVCACLFLFYHVAIGQTFQEGFILLRGGTEQQGLVGSIIPGSPEGVQYKSSESSDVTVYYADDIRGYGVKNGPFQSSLRNPGVGGWVFVQLLVAGELTLVKRNKMYFVIPKNEDKSYHLSHKFRSVLRSVMTDCTYASAKSIGTKLTDADLSAIVQLFNDCVGVKRPNREGERRPVSINLLAGADYTQATFVQTESTTSRYLSSGKLSDKSLPTVGVDVTFRKYKVSNFLGVYTGAFLNSDNYPRRLVRKEFRDAFEVNDYSLRYSEFKVPIGVEFTPFTKEKFAYYLRAGVAFSKIFNLQSTHASQEIEDKPNQNTGGPVDLVYFVPPSLAVSIKKNIAYTVGLGFDYKVADKSRVRWQLNFSSGSGNVTHDSGESNAGNFISMSTMIGYIF